MPFWDVSRVLETLLLGGRDVLVGLQPIQLMRIARMIRE